MTTMLQLVQDAANEMGEPAPATVATNTTPNVVLMLALLNAVGNELARQHQWEALCTEYRFTTVWYQYTGDITNGSTSVTNMSSISGLSNLFSVTGTGINTDTYVSSAVGSTVTLSQAATATTTGATLYFSQTKYIFPTDYDRPINRTQWDKSKHWEMLGPETPQQWQWLKSGYISTGPRIRFRPLGGYFQIWPAVTTNEYLGMEYVSKNWVLSALGVPKSRFTSDDDTCIFPDRLMIIGLKLKYYEKQGFDTTAYARDYNHQLTIAKAGDSGAPTLSFSPYPSQILISEANIPDTGYGPTN